MWFKSKDKESNQWMNNLEYTGGFLLVWVLIGFCVLLVCALKFVIQTPSRVGFTQGTEIFCHGAMLSLAFGSLGGLIGFLFGIPRQSQQSDRHLAKAGTASDSGTNANELHGDPTNLEQVSDWLTKIILGAGLTQLVKLPGELYRLGEYFKPGFEQSSVLPILILMNSLVFGFFAGYLLTQLFLAQALTKAQNEARNVAVVLDTAGSLEQMGKFTAATATLEAAVSTLRPETPIQTKTTLFERLTYNALYEPPSDGFQKAIRYAEQYIQEHPNNPSARIWANLAAALGQKYLWDSEHQVGQEVLLQTRQRTLEAIGKAIEIQPQMKAWLRTLWNPNDPTKVQSEENDLEVFYGDADFKKLLEP